MFYIYWIYRVKSNFYEIISTLKQTFHFQSGGNNRANPSKFGDLIDAFTTPYITASITV